MLRRLVERLARRYDMVPAGEFSEAVRRREDARRQLAELREAARREAERMAERYEAVVKDRDRLRLRFAPDELGCGERERMLKNELAAARERALELTS